MNPGAQDIVRCDLCKTPVPPFYCDLCHISLCKACVVEHLSDESKDHKVVPYPKRRSSVNYPKCKTHSIKICELHCKECAIPICASCISLGEHDQHRKIDILKILRIKKELIAKDLLEFKKFIYPKHQEVASNIPVQRANMSKNSQRLIEQLNRHGEALHTEIDNVVKRMHVAIEDMDCQHQNATDKQEDKINSTITEITEIISKLQNLLDSDDVSLAFEYISRNEEFRSLPVQFQFTLPMFTPQEINSEQIYQQFGSLSKLAITNYVRPLVDESTIAAEKHDDMMRTRDAMPSLLARLLVEEPRILTNIKTEYGKWILRGISCFEYSQLWACGRDKIIKMYNMQGELVKSVQTTSGNNPTDIAVTRSGDLVYTDSRDRSINLVSNTQIRPLITLQGWKPYSVCCTSSNDLLVIMDSDDWKQTKVVRYSGSIEKQSIQWDAKGQPLYSSHDIKYLSENKNLDICVADRGARAVVVVSAAGKLRFRYTGPTSITKKSFDPLGITTDSQSRILTIDYDNHNIHILDKDGQFLRFINNCVLQRPWSICVDSRDNLFVAEYSTGEVKKIQYYK